MGRLHSYSNVMLLLPCLFWCDSGFASEYSGEISYSGEGISIYAHDVARIRLRVKNTGDKTWDSYDSDAPVRLSYHLFSRDGKQTIQFDNARTPFHKKLEPGDSLSVDLKLDPHPVGDYVVRVDIVAESLAWFGARGGAIVDIPLRVLEFPKTMPKPRFELSDFTPKIAWYLEGEEEINNCAEIGVMTLTRNLASFEYEGEPAYGFFAGSGYPQIWIRDSATIMPIARYLHTRAQLFSWIRAHLHAQQKNGMLQDWIRDDGEYDKNTAESDQESSMVISAYEISKTIGHKWLLDEVESQTILDRIDAALSYLFMHRADPATGLIRSGHTADWGDVTNEFPDQRAVDLQDGSKEVVGIYTNSLAYGAAIGLAEMLRSLGRDERAAHWDQMAQKCSEGIQRVLWQEEKGYFKTHEHVGPYDHLYFSEDNIFAMGGNALAVEYGVADSTQAKSIFTQAIFRQKMFNFSTISGSLLPPYPKGFFKHPILDDYFEYQNGGQWDWFGSRLLLQMLKGDEPYAYNKLREICAKIGRNKGFFEWDTMDGKGRGSSNYTGSAATTLRAVVEGLFGIDWKDGKIRIAPNLETTAGYLYVPRANDERFIAYTYTPSTDPATGALSIKIEIGSNANEPETLVMPNRLGEYVLASIRHQNATNEAVQIARAGSKIEAKLGVGRHDVVVHYRKIQNDE